MADISKIQLPNTTTIVNIKDEIARQMTLNVTYTPGANNTPGDLAFSFGSAPTADDEEF